MGGGASKNSTPPAKNSKPRNTTAGDTSDEDAQFISMCKGVFKRADQNHDGVLDKDELRLVLKSKTLGLNLSEDEVNDIAVSADTDNSGEIDYEEFVPLLKTIMTKIYAAKDDDRNDWSLIRNPDTDEVLYLNKRTGGYQSSKPLTFNENRVDVLEYETVSTPSGGTLTVRTNDNGTKEYMDWDKQQWIPYDPDAKDQDGDGLLMYTPPGATQKQEVVFHPVNITNLFYLDEASGFQDYKYVPFSYLATTSQVAPLLVELREYFPKWKNTMQMVMCLHICGYNSGETMRFVEDNGCGDDESTISAEQLGELSALKSEVASLRARLKESLGDEVEKMVEKEAARTRAAESRAAVAEAKLAAVKDEVKSAQARAETNSTEAARLKAENDRVVTEAAAAKTQAATLEKQASVQIVAGGAEANSAFLRRMTIRKTGKATVIAKRFSQTTAKVESNDSNDDTENKETTQVASENVTSTADTEQESSNTKQPTPDGNGNEEIGNLAQSLKEAEHMLEEAEAEIIVKTTALEGAKQALDANEAELAACKGELSVIKASQADRSAITTSMNLMLKQVRTLKATNAQTSSDAKDALKSLAPLVNGAISEAKGLNNKIAEGNIEIVKKYNDEVKLRKSYYNTIQELKGNIRVFLRVRKENRGVYEENTVKGIFHAGVFGFTNKTELTVQDLNPNDPPRKYSFARVYDTRTEQSEVFEETKDIILSVIDGYNICIMAYGQTGSGKTWTMMGPVDNPGVNRRAILLLLNHLKNLEAQFEYQIDASQIEVYNEGVYDLLSKKDRAETKIKPRQLPKGVELPGLTWRSVKTDEDMYQVMIDGDKNRSVMATAMNSASSRSHLLFQVRIRTKDKISGASTDSTMVLVDLAGSERVAKSEVTGDGMKEAAAINQSLSALGQVFGALAKKDPHVPYRNSALTHVLANSLGGNSKTCMFAACSPLESNLSETISTLKFATNISKVELGKAKSSKK